MSNDEKLLILIIVYTIFMRVIYTLYILNSPTY